MTVKPGDRLRITDASERWRLRHSTREATVTAVSAGLVELHWHGAAHWYSVRGTRLVRDGAWLAFAPYSDSV